MSYAIDKECGKICFCAVEGLLSLTWLSIINLKEVLFSMFAKTSSSSIGTKTNWSWSDNLECKTFLCKENEDIKRTALDAISTEIVTLPLLTCRPCMDLWRCIKWMINFEWWLFIILTKTWQQSYKVARLVLEIPKTKLVCAMSLHDYIQSNAMSRWMAVIVTADRDNKSH